MSHYEDDPSKYIQDSVLVAQAMMRAREADEAAAKLKAEALAVAAREQAKAEDIVRRTNLSVANNQQLLAKSIGVHSASVISSADVGMVAPKVIIDQTPVNWGGIQLGPKQAQQMVAEGQISQGEYQAMLTEALAKRGFKAPSFR